MEQHVLDFLTRFCAGQQEAFDGRAWLGRTDVDVRAVSVAAKYLSMTSWYGHEDDLERIATELNSRIGSREAFHREVEDIGFDLRHFSAAIRYEIARQRMGRAPARTVPPAWASAAHDAEDLAEGGDDNAAR
jgi:hypothetical protein